MYGVGGEDGGIWPVVSGSTGSAGRRWNLGVLELGRSGSGAQAGGGEGLITSRIWAGSAGRRWRSSRGSEGGGSGRWWRGEKALRWRERRHSGGKKARGRGRRRERSGGVLGAQGRSRMEKVLGGVREVNACGKKRKKKGKRRKRKEGRKNKERRKRKKGGSDNLVWLDSLRGIGW